MAYNDDYPQVRYTQYFRKDNKLSPRKYSGACFSSLSETAEKVVFHCEVDKELTPEEIEFFLTFMSNVLDKTKFSVKYKDVYKIKFKLDKTSLNHKTSLLYLTFFRYLQEFPDIVKELFKHKNEKLETLFTSFQYIHHLNKIDKFPIRWENISGHGLMFDYSARDFKSIDILTLQTRLKNQRIKMVQDFWKAP